MRYDFITFDCYGTLIDWESGIAEEFARAGITADREAVIHAYHDEEPQVEGRGGLRPPAGARSAPLHKRYREVLSETALRVARKLGKNLTRDQAGFLPESLGSWTPFPDTNPALEKLRAAGCRLGILSNVDNDLLAETLRHFTVDFSLLITAEKVRSYKPAHGHFLTARQQIGEARWLHAAQSYVHDVVPATELGIPVAWINRKRESPSGAVRPTVEFANLEEFARWCVV